MSGIDDELDAILKGGQQDQEAAGAGSGSGAASTTTTIISDGPSVPGTALETPATPVVEKPKVEDTAAGSRRKKAKAQPGASPAATSTDEDEDEGDVEDEHLTAVRATYPGLAEAALLELAAGRRRLAEHAAHTASEE